MATVTALTDSRFLVMERPLLLDMLRERGWWQLPYGQAGLRAPLSWG